MNTSITSELTAMKHALIFGFIPLSTTAGISRDFVTVFMRMTLHYLDAHPQNYAYVIRSLFSLVQEYDDIFTKDEINMLYYLDDGFDLATQHITGSLKEIQRELKHFLESYK